MTGKKPRPDELCNETLSASGKAFQIQKNVEFYKKLDFNIGTALIFMYYEIEKNVEFYKKEDL